MYHLRSDPQRSRDDQHPDPFRRHLLKIGWLTPVIRVVSLPAHAQTSPPPVTTTPGIPLLYISGVLSNPPGGDCGPTERELVRITNGGSGPADLSSHRIDRYTLTGWELIATLSGTLAAGADLEVDVCQGTTPGDSAVLNNTSGGAVRLAGPDGDVDTVLFDSVPNGSPNEGLFQGYGPNPSGSTPRSG